MDEMSKKLVEELNKLYASGKMGEAETKANPPTDSHVHLSTDAHPIGNLSQALVDDIDALLNKLRDANMPFLLSLVVSTEESEQERKMTISNYSWMPVQICEFIAAQIVLTMPHGFSHIVIDMARQVSTMKGLLDNFFKALGDEEEDDDDE